jgi:predicted Zn-dependent protease
MKFERTLRQASAMPDAEEVPIGTAIERKLPTHQAFAGKWDRADDRALYGPYLTSLVGMLARHSTRPGLKYRVHVVREPTFNAMALPGGVLLVHTGLFTGENRVRSEAELVSVLAHEITHVEKRHTVAAYQYARAALGDTADEAAIAVKMMTLPLSTEYEHEADDGGILLAVEAQYDPRAQVDLWRRSAVKEPGRTQILGGLLSTHPPSAERACRAMRRVNWARDNARWDRFYVGRTNLAKRIPGQVRQF